jgi:hypothetical protein
VSLGAHNIFLLENNGLKFDLNGLKRQSKHGIFKNWYQLGEFYHISNELRENSNKSSEYCKMLLSAFEYSHPLHFAGVRFQDLQQKAKICE